MCETVDQLYVKIVDYKSGNKHFDLAALYYGLSLQLVVYLNMARAMEEKAHPQKTVIPAGILYYNIDDPLIEHKDALEDESAPPVEDEILVKLKSSGLVNGSPEVIRLLDRDFTKDSQVIPVSLTASGALSKRSSVASKQQFDELGRFVSHKVRRFGKEIFNGSIDVNPYIRELKRHVLIVCSEVYAHLTSVSPDLITAGLVRLAPERRGRPFTGGIRSTDRKRKRRRITMAARWTDEQQKAIDLRHSNILVSAAAGSGKTAVLVERIFSMLTDLRHPLNIDNLLVVTFTNAAAAEMKERVEERLSKSLQEDPGNEHIARQLASIHSAQIMTIHSFCLYVIRNHFNEIDLDPAFRIGEETELKLLRGDVVQTLLEKRYENGDADFLDFVECFAKGKLDAGIEDLILSVYEYSRSYPSPKLWLRGCLDSFSAEDVQALDRLAAVQFLYADVRRQIKELQRTLREALALCTEPDGPVFYEDMLAQDLKTVDALEACRSYDDYFHVLAGLSFAPLSRKKMPDASETKKTQVKNMRAFVKDTLTALRDDFFPTDGGRAAAALRRMASPMAVLVSLVEEFSQLYQEAKEARNMVDFGDLEHFALKILTRYEDGRWLPTDAAVELSDQYEEILIDEYQDSNQVQETILGSISRERLGHPNMFMVGDVKQSIYKFRLAKPELFMEKYKTYPKRDERYQRIELHKNFRSRDTVINTVNFLFRQLMAADLGDIDYDDDAALYPGAEFKVPDDLSVTWADTSEVLLVTPGDELAGKIAEDRDDTLPGGRTAAAEKAEAAGKAVTAGEAAAAEAEGQTAMTERELEAHGIALRIRELVEGPSPLQIVDKERQEFRPVTYGDIVILLRTMSGWADTFVRVLNEENIPAQAETVTGFFSALEIQTMLSMLSVIDNPRQDIALAAVLKSPAAGLDDEQLAMIASVFGHPREHPHTLYDCCRAFLADGNGLVFGAVLQQGAACRRSGKARGVFSLLERFRDAVPYTPVHELILRVCEETGYYAYVSAMPGGAARRANLDMLVEKAVDYEKDKLSWPV